ncbi:mycothiol S-conjugate amidase [Paramicrobacterium humi]|uniref:Mycothiol S-conjugate amidase n=1 Tax=Paramicrobacterium humi TaxID=640635 RepID=A0A1H4IN05_9MICO|nr:mycothiol conjugate amidase Mca [Microbacterium humi]SEB35245.1 mycothiol S-conjugate amidase [Microbacterium humi]
MTYRLLAVHAHPDDESSKGSATMAYYRSRGVDVMVVSCTGGEGGEILNESLAAEAKAMADRDMPGLRRREMAAAQEVLGVRHRWLGYHDSGMAREDGTFPHNSFASIPLEVSAGVLVRVLREFRPHVVLTYDENGGYPHPDHIRCHQVSVEAFEAAADPKRYPDAGEPWAVSKLYYDHIFNYPRMKANYDKLLETAPEDPLAERLGEMLSWRQDQEDRSTTHIPCGDFFEVRDAALRAHASQVAPDSAFFFWSNDLQRSAWPYEDYELARSRVDAPEDPHDFFAGIEDTE